MNSPNQQHLKIHQRSISHRLIFFFFTLWPLETPPLSSSALERRGNDLFVSYRTSDLTTYLIPRVTALPS